MGDFRNPLTKSTHFWQIRHVTYTKVECEQTYAPVTCANVHGTFSAIINQAWGRLMRNLLQGVMALTLLFFTAISAMANETILTVSGIPTDSGALRVQEYDLAQLRDIGEVSFTTTTPWTEGEQTFTGVPLSKLVASLNLQSGVLMATAVNDYAVEIPMSDALQDGPIIAFLRNDKQMSVREKGPLWIVYPYDSDAKFRTEIVYSQSIWQLDRIMVSD
ncbi:hypothetical protein CLV88_101405 [Shimia abyssi]|uniref:Oxidoreductase molybdopterin-binding domain-containing protein n=2 Tax=Shimia abyssi TaxID=1662395 RepID=A0A2P8FJU4_9RHOB|nr:hypothetical protein CLV88_101405 [Shimia abyssi]